MVRLKMARGCNDSIRAAGHTVEVDSTEGLVGVDGDAGKGLDSCGGLKDR